MDIMVDRFVSDEDTTISSVFVDGRFMCFGLEDEYRENKVSGETRIAAGRYAIKVRAEGGFHQRYSRKFPQFHQGMLHVRDVPEFEYILIHIGNTDENTDGCLLLGEQAVTSIGDMRVNQSRVAYERLYQHVIGAALIEDLFIEYVDNDQSFQDSCIA